MTRENSQGSDTPKIIDCSRSFRKQNIPPLDRRQGRFPLKVGNINHMLRYFEAPPSDPPELTKKLSNSKSGNVKLYVYLANLHKIEFLMDKSGFQHHDNLLKHGRQKQKGSKGYSSHTEQERWDCTCRLKTIMYSKRSFGNEIHLACWHVFFLVSTFSHSFPLSSQMRRRLLNWKRWSLTTLDGEIWQKWRRSKVKSPKSGPRRAKNSWLWTRCAHYTGYLAGISCGCFPPRWP